MPPRPFATFADLAAGDIYGLAAAGLDLFRTDPQVYDSELEAWLRGLVAERGQTVLGIPTDNLAVEVVEHRILLLWERAMVASRRINNLGTNGRPRYLLLDIDVLNMTYEQRLSLLRAAGGIEDLR